MRTNEDIRLEAKESDMIVAAIDGIVDDDVMHRDVVDICEALASNIIKIVKEVK